MDLTPDASDLWEGIAGHFDSITQVLCEFIDNSISNFEANKVITRTVRINISTSQSHNELYDIQVEDSGTGIKHLQPAFTLGNRSVLETPLNEHGFGLKHALASANHDNDNWEIYTRTKNDFDKGEFDYIKAPYSYDLSPRKLKVSETQWPGIINNSGTLVKFSTTKTFFNTVRKGIRGNPSFKTCLDYLVEELGYIYSGVIEAGKANITITSDSDGYNKIVSSVSPDWIGYYKPGRGSKKIDLGGGTVEVNYEFGEIGESSKYKKHYLKNSATSGLELRINGRMIMHNLFKSVWELEPHPSFNHFLAIIDIKSDDRNALPKTRTSKNGIRSSDPKLEKLFAWLKKAITPSSKTAGAVSERELVEKLKQFKDTHIRADDKKIETEYKVYKNIESPVAVDLYVFDGNDVVLYEAKKDNADMKNVYQLLMYWDGAVADGVVPNEGVLIASTFSPGVDTILGILNASTDREGNNYKFVKKTWNEEGIKYPE